MRSSNETFGRHVLVRLAVVGLVSGAVAGCSSDTNRFAAEGGAPMGTAPASYGGQPAPEVTGSLRTSAPTGMVTSSQLPPPGQGGPSSYASAGNQPLYGSPAYNSGQSYGTQGYGASAAPAKPGTHVVQAGETLGSVARTYSVTPDQLGAANGIAPGMTVRTGQSLVIPQRSSVAQAPQPAAPAPRAVAAAPAPAPAPAPKQVQVAATPAKPADAMPADTKAAAKTQAVAASPAPPPAGQKADAKVETAAKLTQVADADDGPRGAGSGPQFRAPVRGRVIAGYGPKPGGTHNDGVNFAVPEGTAVRAAEDGTVAYAGNELKGFGNLVLIKHADGYVTAYAHASEIDVKRGDQVRRGQVIAKAGQSGNVSTPQLHFEIRKGNQPVDPSRYVAGL
ncbi:M23 family metallopeptidase [Xanthobacter tagetidis]|uniref:M23 family metallopeptidase n=1 Tax=Xanthobacter tagetidis TaxID=60216 RepID=A0A3L6ZY55_9HYPH|nr:M23 family metallopeptidase [Xanthobacter tagetidis]MBB6310188.1 murein DD-endopeptidase MepM/ murein hydrolase activator NlpD [Xanthobacter tagetidis]RLP72847.1 M23 family metallopeptidase [Xanthobacter tagetidis]